MQTPLTGSALARIRWASKPEGELKRGAVGPPAAPGCDYKLFRHCWYTFTARSMATQFGDAPT